MEDYNIKKVAITSSSTTLSWECKVNSVSEIKTIAVGKDGSIVELDLSWEKISDSEYTATLTGVYSAVYIMRESAFSNVLVKDENGDITTDSIIAMVERLIAVQQEDREQIRNAIKVTDGGNMVLPCKEHRKNKFMSFDDNGNPVTNIEVDTLDKNRQKARAWAVGDENDAETKNNNAKYYAETAQASALSSSSYTIKARAWAIGDGNDAETKNNNARHYADSARGFVNGFDSKVDEATRDFNSNASDKKDEFDKNCETKKGEINQIASDVNSKVDGFDSKVDEATRDFNSNASGVLSQVKGYATEAKNARDEAVEIVDPEGWRTDTRANISSLAVAKANRGEFWFNGGLLQNDTLKYSQGNPFSFAVNFRANKADIEDIVGAEKQVNIFDGRFLYLYFPQKNPRLAFYAPSGVLGVTYIYDEDNERLLNGEWHSLIVSYDGTTLKLSDETGVLMSASATLQSQASSSPIKLGYNLVGQMRSIKYFNFDMSDANAPYTIADYIAGKDESPSLKTTQPVIEWTNYGNAGTINGNSIEYNNASSNVYPRPFGSSPVFNVGTTYEFKAIRSNSNSDFRLSSTNNTNGSCDISWSRINLTTGNTFDGTSTQMRDLNVFGVGQVGEVETIVKFTPKVSGIVPYFAVDKGMLGSITILYVRAYGALLSLDDYSISVGGSKIVPDVSGNLNDATITGAVYGSKDNSIARLSALIGQANA